MRDRWIVKARKLRWHLDHFTASKTASGTLLLFRQIRRGHFIDRIPRKTASNMLVRINSKTTFTTHSGDDD